MRQPQRGVHQPIITARQRSCGKVMFSLVSLCLFTGDPSDHYLQCIGPHCTAPPPPTSDMGPPSSSPPGHHWRLIPVPNLRVLIWGSNPPISTDIWWPKHIWLASGWHASYWNAFLAKFLAENCMKLKEFGPREGWSARPWHPSPWIHQCRGRKHFFQTYIIYYEKFFTLTMISLKSVEC